MLHSNSGFGRVDETTRNTWKGLLLLSAPDLAILNMGFNDSVPLQIYVTEQQSSWGKERQQTLLCWNTQQNVSEADALLGRALLMLEVISIKTLSFFCIRATRYNPAFQKDKSVFVSSLGFNVNNKGLIQ